MQIAQVLAGYTLGGADLLRRAMGKKIKSEMDAQRASFIEGAAKNGVEEARASMIFDQVGEVRGLRLQQEPRRALCAGRLPDGLSEGELSGRVLRRLDDPRHGQHRQARRLPPRARAARRRAAAARRQQVDGRVRRRDDGRTARRACATRWPPSRASAARPWSGWPRSARRNGPFKDLFDFAERLDQRVVNKRLLESLVKAGAFDIAEQEPRPDLRRRSRR